MNSGPLRGDNLLTLSVRSDAKGLARLGGHLAVLAATGTLVWSLRDSPLVVPALILHGYVVSFLFCALHEATHFTAFRSRWLNHAVGHGVGFTLLLPFWYFRQFHWDHHRFTQDVERDPELINVKPETPLEYLYHATGLQNWKRRVQTLLEYGLLGRVTQPWIPADKQRTAIFEARLYLLAYLIAFGVSVAAQSWVLVWLWIVPGMIGQLFLRNYLLAEHTGCANSGDMFDRTRSIDANRWVSFFAWNMPFHAEHHAYPSVPFHALPALRALVEQRLKHRTKGYVRTLTGLRSAPTARPAG